MGNTNSLATGHFPRRSRQLRVGVRFCHGEYSACTDGLTDSAGAHGPRGDAPQAKLPPAPNPLPIQTAGPWGSRQDAFSR